MSYAVERSGQSIRDIEEAFVYIAEGDLDKAVLFLVAVEDTLEILSVNPLIGSNRQFESKKLNDLRIWRVKGFENYLLVYSTVPEKKVVRILRLLNANRDFDLIFD